MSFSRAAWLIGLGAVLWLGLKAGAKRLVQVLLIVGFVLIVALSFPGVDRRIADISNPNEDSAKSHLRLYQTAIYMTEKKPFFGWGPRSFKEVVESLGIDAQSVHVGEIDAHNLFLQESAESGLPALGLLFVFLFAALRRAHMTFKNSGTAWYGLFVGGVGLLAMSMTMNAFRTEFFWCVLGALLATSEIAQEVQHG